MAKSHLSQSPSSQYFNALAPKYLSSSSFNSDAAGGSQLKSVLTASDLSELFDYDFTETAVNLLSTPLMSGTSYP